jgi:SNF2 family DNA or RNA helicase
VEDVPLPSLVVCPSSVVGHWVHEIQTFCPPTKGLFAC